MSQPNQTDSTNTSHEQTLQRSQVSQDASENLNSQQHTNSVPPRESSFDPELLSECIKSLNGDNKT